MDAGLTLAPRQDLGAAPRLRDWFLAQDGDARIDATAVEIVTTPALQVLISGSDMIRRKGHRFEVACPSAAFTRCLADLGCTLSRLTEGPRPEGRA
ncbi:STAS domain-containing protein [Jannaschia formosa]|uniref:STAS domain-containing protein n=1 Tax=Jannaschia formosa TaxID=2259592 RepID=UPI000E1C3A45|nr:STAS domain-containing protein [Jannaschia formosa]TFL16723.1 hypothetical protein DR046_18265 [Jannaschia formosa]